MDVAAIAKQILDALTSGLTGLVKVVPESIKNTFENLFLTTTGTGESATTNVSTFAIVMLVFGGVALAFGITKLVFHLVRSKIG